jgi:hypothetical protein
MEKKIKLVQSKEKWRQKFEIHINEVKDSQETQMMENKTEKMRERVRHR